MIAGEQKPDKGTVRVGDTVKLMYVQQDRMGLDDKKSVFDNINDGYVESPLNPPCSGPGPE
jgi:ATPase subunit of ABC transporter with duplicated ATPase domains